MRIIPFISRRFIGTAVWMLLLSALFIHNARADQTLVVEAENYTANLSPRSSHQWALSGSLAGYSGTGYMQGGPADGVGQVSGTTSPELQYNLTFLTTGTYFAYIDGYATANTQDSAYIGIDEVSSEAVTLNQYNTWQWSGVIQGQSGTASIIVSSTGQHTVSFWMREPGLSLDRFLLTSATNYSAKVGAAWHTPCTVDPAGSVPMRSPFTVNNGASVTITNGSQFQGTGNPGNQLSSSSAVFYKRSQDSTWSSVSMSFNTSSGNNKYYSGTIPSSAYTTGDTIQYYIKVPFSDHLTTYLYGADTQSSATDVEATAQANPFTFTVQSQSYWQGQSIYQIITDRFYDGDSSNNNADGNYSPSSASGVHGGDFKGLQKKLNYIKSLGATAIWISPVVVNGNGDYHGYSGRDFYNVDPHWGSMTDLKNMVTAAHTAGLQVIDDIVVNHASTLVTSTDAGYPAYIAPPGGYDLQYYNSNKTYPTPFDLNATNPTLTSIFHNNGNISDFNNTTEVIVGQLEGLNDFKTETPYVQNAMAAIYEYWITQAGFDAFRIDTVKHVDQGFWQAWSPQIHAAAAALGKPNFFMFGEVDDGSNSLCGSFTGIQSGGAYELDSVVDYPLYFVIGSVFSQATGNTQQIESRYAQLAANYDLPAQNRLVTFLDNHDQPRFLSSNNADNNLTKLNLALTFLYTSRGIPCLYYGTEQAFDGGTSPNNREDMFDGQFEQGPSVGDNFNETHPEFQFVAKLNNFRRLYPALSVGTHVNQWNNSSGPGLFAYSRRNGSQEVLVVLNTANSTQTLPARTVTYATGTTLVNLLSPTETIGVASGSQTPSISVPARSEKMFIAQSQVLPLDPVITSITPAHDASNTAINGPITLTFSEPMNTASVQSAFSTSPSSTGTFAWSASNSILTYSPSTSLPSTTLIAVTTGTGALGAVSGRNFFAPFEARFKTGTLTSDTTPPTVVIHSPVENATVSGTMTLSGSAADNVALAKVDIQLDGGAWYGATLSGSSWSFALQTANIANGPHTFAARATDTSGNISAEPQVDVNVFNYPSPYSMSISAGNPSSVVDCSGSTWVADRAYSLGSFGYVSGTDGHSSNAISGVCSQGQPLYQYNRSGTPDNSFSYLFDVAPGIYQVTLFEAETSATGANQRAFDVYIDGNQVLDNFDIYAAAGGQNIPVSEVFTTTVSDGSLEVLFFPQIGNPLVSAIKVQKTAELFSDTDGIPDWWRLAYFGDSTGQDGDGSRGTDDPDGDGMTNLQEYLAGTNPLDPASLFKILSIVRSGTNILVTWPTQLNKTYQLETSGTIVSPSWSNVGSSRPGTGVNVTGTDTGGAAQPSRFYKVMAQ